ncbi:MAG: hypothetical protein AB8B49_04890 [Nitratireductor sp.]
MMYSNKYQNTSLANGALHSLPFKENHKVSSNRKVAIYGVVLSFMMSSAMPAFATIDNTVTVTGSPPTGPNVTATADETVTVEAADPKLSVTKVADNTGAVDDTDTITYTYTLTNDGNQTLANVKMSDPHDAGASGALSTIALAASPLNTNSLAGNSTDDSADNIWDSLAPGHTITWTATYAVTTTDLVTQVGGDGTIDNTATGNATAPGGVADAITADSPAVSVPLDAVDASLIVTKVADDDTLREVGETIVYTYTVTNNGNVAITNVSLVDDVTAGSGADPVPYFDSLVNTSGNSDNSDATVNVVEVLAVGDSVVFKGDYIVTQSDVDNLQ